MVWTKTKITIAAAIMALPIIIILIVILMLLNGPGSTALRHSKAAGDLKILVERIANSEATAQFKFKTVPSPATPNAASNATFSLLAGGRDANGAGLAKLRAGFLPGGPDAPAENFFFKDGEDGGRIQVDLNQAIDIQQVNTYLLFDCKRTEEADRWGNTFYSEIDVVAK